MDDRTLTKALEISTHAPRTGSDGDFLPAQLLHRIISTHAPRTGSDADAALKMAAAMQFQPTLPARGATFLPLFVGSYGRISTHAPRTGSDPRAARGAGRPANFNPRSPHGERHHPLYRLLHDEPFQPTLPARGATRRGGLQPHRVRISTHAPRTGSDDSVFDLPSYIAKISTHAPRTGSDRPPPPLETDTQAISTHAPRTGSDTPADSHAAGGSDFNPRSPHGERPRIFGDLQAFAMISTHAPRTGSDSAK